MAKLYVFGIGGTGSRVIKSLTMLLASGVSINYDVIPIIIDPDNAGGDLNRTVKLLRDYQKIFQEVTDYEENRFFKTKISTLSDIIMEKGGGAKVFDGFRFELDGIQNDRFRDFIDFNALDNTNKNFVRSLFSEANLEADLGVGFKGNPNIGSVVLNQFTRSKAFQSFADSFEEDDRIFIVSSIFGGTGAAGFPLLLKNLRTGVIGGKNYAHLKNSRIGAVTVQPYFKVDRNKQSQIDSHSFMTKTKAALHYYTRNVTGNKSINALYYIGDNADNTYDNVEGGMHQKNDAHFIELASALSIVDFANTSDVNLNTNKGKAINPVYKEFGVKESSILNFNHLFDKTKSVIIQPLTEYFYFNLFLKEKFLWSIKKSFPFVSEDGAKFDENFTKQSFFREFLTDFNTQFRIWLAELYRNQISFAPFAIAPLVNEKNEVTDYKVNTNSIYTVVTGISERKNKLNPFAKNNYELFVAELNNASHKLGDAPSVEKRFMGVFSKGIESLIQKKLL